MRRALVTLLVLVPVLAGAAPASAGTTGTWTPVTDPDTSNIKRVGLFRTPDGVLHVAWSRPNTSAVGDDEIAAGTISRAGDVGTAVSVASGYAGVAEPDINRQNGGAGLATIFGSIHGNAFQNNNVSMATSDDSGAAWTLFPDDVITGGSAYAGNIRLATSADGTLFQTWAITSGVYVHRGVDKNTPNFEYHYSDGASNCCGYEPDVGVDGASGAMWVSWFSLSSDKPGPWVRQVDPASGAPIGAAIQMPGTMTDFNGTPSFSAPDGFTAITGRPGKAGVYMAFPTGYPNHTALLVWRVGDPAATTLDTAKDGNYRQVAITSDPSGHVWVVWGYSNPTGGPLYARRSNADGTGWGPKVPIARLAGAQQTWQMSADAQDGVLDLLVNFTESNGSTTRYYHTQVPPLPPPTLGRTVNAAVVSGTVRVKLKGSKSFTKLDELGTVPVGSTVDATHGRVRIQTALPGGRTQVSDFFQGVFVLTQAKNGLATMVLDGGNFKKCGAGAAHVAKAKVIRHLWGSGSGKFRTKGRFASAAIRGTEWNMVDRCDGTLTVVKKGSVTVRDLVRKRNVVVKAGHSYLAAKKR